ncbi:MAG: MAPEG family protein [Methylophilaceae bacterium]|nr:MAPEG family protein [Methylophilaceae bacterium]
MAHYIPVVALYAAFLGLLFAWLSIRTIKLRRTLKIGIGDNSNPQMQRAIRVHANFAEYVPIMLILLFFVETSGANSLIVHGLALCLVTGRCLHAYGVSQLKENFRFRTAGMGLTFTSLITSAIYLLFVAAFNIFSA